MVVSNFNSCCFSLVRAYSLQRPTARLHSLGGMSTSPLLYRRHRVTTLTADGNSNNENTHKAPDDDIVSSFLNPNNTRDQVFSAISHDGGIKVTAVTARNLLNDLMLQHHLSPVSADALGRTVLCSLLLANGIQDEQILQLSLSTPTGLLRGVVAVCNGRGHVRGYVGTPQLGDAVPRAQAYGTGAVLQVVQNHPSWPRPYNGITALMDDVDSTVGRYLAQSEQRSCALAAATTVRGFLCTAAGGYLIEQLPGVLEEEQVQVEENLQKLVALDGGDRLPTNLLLQGQTPYDIASIVLEGMGMRAMNQVEPVLKCNCSEERLLRSLRLLPRDEVEDILIKEEKIEARCEFCGTVYRMGPEEVREKLAAAATPDDGQE